MSINLKEKEIKSLVALNIDIPKENELFFKLYMDIMRYFDKYINKEQFEGMSDVQEKLDKGILKLTEDEKIVFDMIGNSWWL